MSMYFFVHVRKNESELGYDLRLLWTMKFTYISYSLLLKKKIISKSELVVLYKLANTEVIRNYFSRVYFSNFKYFLRIIQNVLNVYKINVL